MLIIILAVALVLLVILLLTSGAYQHRLNLVGITKISELHPSHLSIFDGMQTQFVFIADKLKAWKREQKSLADYVEDEEHKKAILNDLYGLRDWVAIELRKEQSKPVGNQLLTFIERREYFLRETIPYEESKLLSWEPSIKTDERFDFDELKGSCILTYQGGSLAKARLQMQETGIFSIEWKQAGEMAEERELIQGDIYINSASVAIDVQINPPKNSGTLYITNNLRPSVFERVPVA